MEQGSTYGLLRQLSWTRQLRWLTIKFSTSPLFRPRQKSNISLNGKQSHPQRKPYPQYIPLWPPSLTPTKMAFLPFHQPKSEADIPRSTEYEKFWHTQTVTAPCTLVSTVTVWKPSPYTLVSTVSVWKPAPYPSVSTATAPCTPVTTTITSPSVSVSTCTITKMQSSYCAPSVSVSTCTITATVTSSGTYSKA
jgi:hypothetical protein